MTLAKFLHSGAQSVMHLNNFETAQSKSLFWSLKVCDEMNQQT